MRTIRAIVALAILFLIQGQAHAQTVPTLPVTATQGTSPWLVQPANVANTTAWLVTGTGGTFPATQSGVWSITNISGTVSLPTGAATAAKQPAIGTAGTASADVISVQGIASMTPLLATLSGTNNIATVTAVTAITNALPAGTNAIGKLSANSGVNIGTVDVATSALPTGAATAANQATEITALNLIDNLPNTLGSTTSGQSGVLGIGAVTTSAPTYTNGQSNAISLTTAGSVRVDVMNGGGGGTSVVDNATFTDNTSSLTPIGGVAESASPTACAEGKFCAVATSLNRAIKAMLVAADGSTLTPSNDATAGSAVVATGPQVHLDARTSSPTAVSTGQAVRALSGIDGIQIVRPHSLLENRVSGVAGVSDGSSTSLVAAQGSGVRFCATLFVVANSSASTNVTVDIRDGTGGAVLMTIPAAAASGGAVVPLQTPLCTSANTAMAADPSASATTITTTAVGFKAGL